MRAYEGAGDGEAQAGSAMGMRVGNGNGNRGATREGAMYADTTGNCELASHELMRMRAAEGWLCPVTSFGP